MIKFIFPFFIFLIQISLVLGQPDSRFRPFDWVLYRGAESITSITEGYTYAYIGTKAGGLKRLNLFGNNFEEPITIAQGLKDNYVTATHFDKQTGLIWVSTPKYVQYSFSREGDWYSRELQDLGLSRQDRINQIGSSSSAIWLKAFSSYVKLDHSSGTLIGVYPTPDELDIMWSSGRYTGQPDLKKIFMNYNAMEGWIMNGDEFIDPLGRRVEITTGLIANHGNVFVGVIDGTFFHGTTTMESFYPLNPDIVNTDVVGLFDDGKELWIGSSDFVRSKGISWLNLQTFESGLFEFEATVNMNPTPITSV